ncbi:MAG: HAD family hydrolase [Aggregatilineales bacterium]
MQTTLFFDIDETLVDNQFSRKALGTLLQEIADHTGKDVRELGREMWLENSRRQKEDPDNVLTMDWDDILDRMAEKYEITLSAKGIDMWRQFAHIDDVVIYDNVHDVLDTLKASGYRLMIATKGLTKYQLPVLEVAGLMDHFEMILAPDVTGYLKTSPAYFDKYYNQPDMRYVQIGDHYVDDVICPKRNGFTSIMRAPITELADHDAFERPQHLVHYQDQISTYPKSGTDVVPDAAVLSLQELPDVLSRLETMWDSA